MQPTRPGEKGELWAAIWYAEHGAQVYIPLRHNHPHVDLIADWGDRVDRVKVKTSNCFRKGRWDVTLCTRGGNQSWSGMVKRLDPDRYDRLLVHVGDGRRWLIPAHDVEGGSGIRVGGPKYEAYEIEPGEHL